MKKKPILCFCMLLLSLSAPGAASSEGNVTPPQQLVPSFRVDPFWPKMLPNKWLVGAVAGVAVDRDDHVWIIHRPGTLQPNETRAGWRGAPPVLEFDAAGNLLAAWGGSGEGYEWPDLEHGIYVDARNNVWIAGAGQKDAQVLKFTRDGKFVLQIGHSSKSRGSNDTENLGSPSNDQQPDSGVQEGRQLRQGRDHSAAYLWKRFFLGYRLFTRSGAALPDHA
jgi:hypothetical protein